MHGNVRLSRFYAFRPFSSNKVNKSGDTMAGTLSFSDIMGGERTAEIIQWNGETHLRNRDVAGSDYYDIVIKTDGLYYSYMSGGETKSIKIAPPTPPQKYNLPLAEGLQAIGGTRATYCKSQSGRVYVEAYIAPGTGGFDISHFLFTLPVGYLPGEELIKNATIDNGSIMQPCRIHYNPQTHNFDLWQASGGLLTDAKSLVVDFAFQAAS